MKIVILNIRKFHIAYVCKALTGYDGKKHSAEENNFPFLPMHI
jgi:hypothetical protein